MLLLALGVSGVDRQALPRQVLSSLSSQQKGEQLRREGAITGALLQRVWFRYSRSGSAMANRTDLAPQIRVITLQLCWQAPRNAGAALAGAIRLPDPVALHPVILPGSGPNRTIVGFDAPALHPQQMLR